MAGRAREIDRWDVRVSERIAGADVPAAIDRALPALTRAADHSKLWLALGAALAATGNARARRAAARGLGSVAASSLLANQLGKRAIPRRRPDLAGIPLRRVAHRVPVSSSFPSGHSASAAAFAVGVVCEAPALAAPAAALAGAVAFSRIYTGVHYTSDVLAGLAIGAAVAGAGKLVVPARSAPPVRPGDEPRVGQPPRPTGRGLVAVVNPSSGDGIGPPVLDQLRGELPDAEFVELREDDDPAEVLSRTADRAEVLGVAGGDGTVNAAAQVAMARDLPLLVLPAGTFNHFAQDLDLADLAASVEALGAGRAVRIDVGMAGEEPFLNTASLGSYPQFVRIRERWERRLGKPLAAAVAMLAVLRRAAPLPAEVDGRPRRLLMLFVGNGSYRPRGFVPRWRPRLDSGEVDVRFVDADGRGAWLPLIAGVLTGNVHRSRRYVELHRPEVQVRVDGAPAEMARDGEVGDAPQEVTFRVRRRALTVFRGAPLR